MGTPAAIDCYGRMPNYRKGAAAYSPLRGIAPYSIICTVC